MFLSRFLFQSGDAAKSKQEVKPRGVRAVFVEETSRFELSVFNTANCTHEQIVQLGTEVVGKERKEPLKYYVGFPESVVQQVALKVENDKLGHDLHCNILDWPQKDEERLEKSVELARAINSSASKKFWSNPES